MIFENITLSKFEPRTLFFFKVYVNALLPYCLPCSWFFCSPFILVCSLKPQDPDGSPLSISNPIRDRAPRRDERGADQSRRRLCRATQHLSADERGRRRCCRGRRLREIAGGTFVGLRETSPCHGSQDRQTYF